MKRWEEFDIEPSTSATSEISGESVRGEWLHPLSLVFEVLSGGRQVMLPALFALWGAASGSVVGLIVAGSIFVVQLIVASCRYLSLRYRIDNAELIVQKGFVFRSVRKIPLARIQNVDLVQNPLHRIFGVAEVKIETASGTEPEAVLRVLSLQQVDALRRGIFERPQTTAVREASNDAIDSAHAASDATVASAPVVEETLVHAIPTYRLLLAGLNSNHGFVLISVLVGALYEFNVIGGGRLKGLGQFGFSNWEPMRLLIAAAIVLPIGFVLMRLLSAIWFLLRFHGYRMTRVGKDLRIRCGLVTKIAATVPMNRIQLISVQSTLSLRLLGLATVRVETAGGGGNENENSTETVGRRWFLPVIPQSELVPLLSEIQPGFEWDEKSYPWRGLSKHAASRMVRQMLILDVLLFVVGLVVWFPWGGLLALSLLPPLIWRAIKKAKSNRYFRNDQQIGYRSGTFTRKMSVAFLSKVQCVAWNQSPFDRRWRMASLAIDTAASGPAGHKIQVDMLDIDFAQQEIESLASVLR